MFVPGRRGGWYLSLLWNYGDAIRVRWSELRRVLAGSGGEVLVARKLDPAELRQFARHRWGSDVELATQLVHRDELRWRRARAGKRRRAVIRRRTAA